MSWGQFSALKGKTQEACPHLPHLVASCLGIGTSPGDDTEVTSRVTSSQGTLRIQVTNPEEPTPIEQSTHGSQGVGSEGLWAPSD